MITAHSMIIYSAVLTSGGITQRHVNPGWEHIFYATSFESFYFIVVEEASNFNVRDLYKPLDFATWILAIIAGCAVWAMLKLLRRNQIPVLISVAASIYDQPIPDVRLNLSTKILWGFWLVSLLVLNNSYKGKIYSILTNGGHSNWPENVEQLVEINYPCYTMRYRITPGNMGYLEISSELKLWLHRIITTQGSNGAKYYAKLLNMTTILNGGSFEFSKRVVELQLGYKNQIYALNHSHNFALIDQLQDIKFVSFAIHAFAPNLRVSKPILLPQYSLVHPWAVRVNYFLPVFKLHLSRFDEAGLYNKLKVDEAAFKQRQFLESSSYILRKSAEADEFFNAGVRRGRKIIHYGFSWLQNKSVKKLSWLMLRRIFSLWSFLSILSLLLSFIELFTATCHKSVFFISLYRYIKFYEH